MSSTNVALRLDNLCKSFGRIRAVDHLSLDVHCGQMVGFLGPNGAGKSTTLYMIPRLVRPSAGRIEIFGHNVWDHFKKAIRHVGTMVETPSFYEYLSARKNLKLVARLHEGVTDGQIDNILDRIGLCERQNDKVATYSHGMKQRLGLGMTLLGRPKLLLLDEPTNGMDPEATREILTFLRERVTQDGLAVFISSHLLHEVQEYCDNVFIINHGGLIASGNVKEILARHDNVVRVTFNGATPDCSQLTSQDGIEHAETLSTGSLEITLANRDAAWLNSFLLSKGYEVSALIPRQRTLKEFFLSITGEQNDA